jgi:hypothetical protein
MKYLPSSFWIVQETGDYEIAFAGSGTIKSELRDGNFFDFFGFFLQVNDDQKYPLTATPNDVGTNAYIVGYQCSKAGQERIADAPNMGSGISINSYYYLPATSPEIQYAAAGSCIGANNSWQNGNWVTTIGYNLKFDKVLHLNAGDLVYLYGNMAGAAFKDQGGLHIDPRDIDITITQHTNTLHIVQQ